MSIRRLLVVTNEASGDALAADVVRHLGRSSSTGPEVRAMGGRALAAVGAALEVDIATTTAMGGVEVLRAAPRLAVAWRRVLDLARRWSPEAALLVDSPDWNGPLGAALRARGVPVVGYVAPQVWAWRAGRARRLAERYDKVACVLPFEEATLRRAGVDARFVGHPLAELEGPTRREAEAALGLDAAPRRVALLPGSRPGELRRHLAVLTEVGERLRRRGDVEVLVPEAPTVCLPRLPEGVTPVRSEAGGAVGRLALAASDAAIVASGTATLEAALLGVPQVVFYRLSMATWWAARALVRTRFIALPNLVAARPVVPELLQDRATADALAGWAEALLAGGPEARGQRRASRALRRRRRGRAAAGAVAEMIEQVAR